MKTNHEEIQVDQDHAYSNTQKTPPPQVNN